MSVLAHQGHVLRQARKTAGLGLREVSERSHVALGYISEVERGLKAPHPDLLGSIANAVGMTMPTLLRRTADSLEGRQVAARRRTASQDLR